MLHHRDRTFSNLVASTLLVLGAVACSDKSAAPAEQTAVTSAAWTTIDAGPPPTPTIPTFVLYAERSVTIGDNSNVWGGNVGVRLTAPASFGSQMALGGYVVVENSQSLFSPTASLGIRSSVGDLQTNSLLSNNGHYQTVTPFPAAAMPASPLAQAATPSTTAVTVAGGATQTLSPGNYGDLTVNSHGQVVLTAGVYSFSNITLAEYGHVVAKAGGVNVRVAGTLSVARYSTVEPYCCTGLTASNLTIEVSGADQAGVPAASVLPHSTIQALLLVPHGTLSLGNTVVAKGAFFAFDLVLGSNVDVNFQNGFSAGAPGQQGQQQLSGYITPAMAAAPLVGPVSPSTMIALAISLPVQVPTNFPSLADFARQVSDPSSTRYRQFLTPALYAGYYQPSVASYNALAAFVQSYGLTVTRTYPDNEIIDVVATAAQVGQMVFANMNLYMRSDGSQFFAPDREPSLALSTAVLSVAGVQNYNLPAPAGSGTGPTSGDLWGKDFRNAYVAPCASKFDGTGQAIGLIEFQTFNPSDITAYAASAGISNPSITTVTLTAPFSGSIPTNQNEAPVDIEVAHSMAPGAQIVVFVAYSPAISYGPFGGINFADDMLHAMAHPLSGVPRTYQNSSSYFLGGNDDDTLQELAAIASMGGSFFESSGDGGSFTGNPLDLRSLDNVTVVGGTNIVSFGGGNPPNETGWTGSGGGFFDPLPGVPTARSPGIPTPGVVIPSYQKAFVSSTNQASSMFRNFPDVSMAAQNIADIYTTQSGGSVFPTDNPGSGTSASAPLWAGFMALANQAAQSAGVQTVGFANPVLYGIGAPTGTLYATCFNDITSGNNPPTSVSGAGPQDPTSPAPATGFTAVAGYDLVTGLGSPTCALLAQLASPTPTVPVAPPAPPLTAPLFAGIGPGDTCAIVSGAVECWGGNGAGETGNGNTNPQLTPSCGFEGASSDSTALSTAVGNGHSCTLFGPSGTIFCAGDNTFGQLGPLGAGRPNSDTPVQFQGLPAGNPPIQVSAGGDTTCVVLGNDNSTWCWGRNDGGQLGSGSADAVAHPIAVQVQGLPPSSQVSVSTGGMFACALLEVTGGVSCWGVNTWGNLGSLSVPVTSAPQQVVPVFQLSNGISISAGNTHVCALVANQPPATGNTLYCWGGNASDQLGEGDVNTGAFPTMERVPVVADHVMDCTNAPPPAEVVSVACGNLFTCAATNLGTVVCWGDDSVGELGTGKMPPFPAAQACPSLVVGLAAATGVAAGPAQACAQLSGGAVSCWGAGPVGDGSSGTALTPASAAFTRCP